MSYYTKDFIVMVPPRGLIGSNPENRERRKKNYRRIKQFYASSTSYTGLAICAAELCRDAVKDELKAYGYKAFFTLLIGPYLEVLSVPLYLFSYGTRLTSFAIGVRDLGRFIYNTQMNVLAFPFVALDYILFMEYVPLDETPFININIINMVGNETTSELGQTLESLLPKGE